jgi:hypothetical protein
MNHNKASQHHFDDDDEMWAMNDGRFVQFFVVRGLPEGIMLFPSNRVWEPKEPKNV